MGEKIYYSQFAVGEKPYCVWEWDLPDRNMEYLERVDPTYFDYVGRVNAEVLGTDDEQHAAMAIRTAYHHGLETLFALMFAAIQAPDCVVGWMQRYSMGQLRSLVSSAKRLGGGRLRYAKVKPTEAGARPYTLKGIADMMTGGVWKGEEDAARTRQEFGLLWQRFAEDFLKEHNQDEYNSFKHGLRTSAGGFYLRLGPEETPGVSPPPEKMRTMASSTFGTSFYVTEGIGGQSSTPHFRVKQYRLNWDPYGLCAALTLISFSINNVLSFVKVLNGVDPSEVSYHRPDREGAFREPWQELGGFRLIGMDSVVPEAAVRRFSREEILGVYETETETT